MDGRDYGNKISLLRFMQRSPVYRANIIRVYLVATRLPRNSLLDTMGRMYVHATTQKSGKQSLVYKRNVQTDPLIRTHILQRRTRLRYASQHRANCTSFPVEGNMHCCLLIRRAKIKFFLKISVFILYSAQDVSSSEKATRYTKSTLIEQYYALSFF